MTPDPRTLASIEAGGAHATKHVIAYDCGCDRMTTGDKWHLCQYHQGFDDALDLPAEEATDGE